MTRFVGKAAALDRKREDRQSIRDKFMKFLTKSQASNLFYRVQVWKKARKRKKRILEIKINHLLKKSSLMTTIKANSLPEFNSKLFLKLINQIIYFIYLS